MMASEVGVLDIPPEESRIEGPLAARAACSWSTRQGRIIADEEIKTRHRLAQPVPPVARDQHLARVSRRSADGQREVADRAAARRVAAQRQQAVRLHAGRPANHDGADGDQRPGADRLDGQRHAAGGALRPAAAALQLLQAAVRPGDQSAASTPIREEIVTSLITTIGPEGNLLDETPEQCRQLRLEQPILTNDELARIKAVDQPAIARAARSACCSRAAEGAEGMETALDELRAEAVAGHRRRRDAADPLRPRRERRARRRSRPAGHRRRASSPDPRRARARAAAWSSRPARRARCITSRCSSATAPARSIRTWPSRRCSQMQRRRLSAGRHRRGETLDEQLHQGDRQGLLKVMSKMGISTLQSYRARRSSRPSA